MLFRSVSQSRYDAANSLSDKLRELSGSIGNFGLKDSNGNSISSETISKNFKTNDSVLHKTADKVGKTFTETESGDKTVFGKMLDDDYQWSLKNGFTKKDKADTNAKKPKGSLKYDNIDAGIFDGAYELSDIDRNIEEAKYAPEDDLYRSVLRTIKSSSGGKSGEVDVKVTITGEDTANIKVSKDNRILTERKVKFSQASN